MNFDPWAAVREAERRVADPESGALVLDPRAPLDTAKAYLQTTLADGIPTIAYWRGQFHSWRGSG